MGTRDNLFETVSAERSLELLRDGNKRYLSGTSLLAVATSQMRRDLSEKGQFPFAAVLSCSDSRVPPEIVFDVSLGQLFTVRTAGHIADPVTIGSIEFAVSSLKTNLVLVLGHDKCGAVKAAVSGAKCNSNIDAVIEAIKPAVEIAYKNVGDDEICACCEDEHVRQTAARLAESAVLKERLDDGTLKIVCAKYMLESGEVIFFE